MRICLPACISFAALTVAAYAVTLPPIPTHSGWITFKNIEQKDRFKIFRRYGYMGDDANPFPNLIMFNCAKDVTKGASHLTFVLPKDFQPDSFPRSSWLPKIDVRFLIDDDLSVRMPGEYRKGEFYFDINTGTSDNFTKIMLADKLAIGFGDKNDIIQFEFTEKIDGFFSEYVDKFIRGQFGDMIHYSRAGIGSVTESCTAYQQSGAEKPKGPEEVLIILFSTVAALEVDCSFKTNRGELQKLTSIHGFKIEDFLPTGRFSEQMRERINYNHGFIKEKGCKAVRGIVRNNFPTVGR